MTLSVICIGNTIGEIYEYIEFLSDRSKLSLDLWEEKFHKNKLEPPFFLENFTKGKTYKIYETSSYFRQIVDDKGRTANWQKDCVIDSCFIDVKIIRKLKLEEINNGNKKIL